MSDNVEKTTEKHEQNQIAGNGDVFVFLEQTGGQVEEISLEVLGKAREIGDQLGVGVVGILLGEGIEKAAIETSARGADLILTAESPLLRDFTTEAYSKVVAELLRQKDPDIFLVGATHNGTSLAASLAVKLGAGLMAHVVDLEIEKETQKLLGFVPGFGGNIVAVCKCKRGRPQMATVRPGIFKPLPIDATIATNEMSDAIEAEGNLRKRGTGRVERFDFAGLLSPEDVKCKIIEKSVGRSVEITHAEKTVVAGLGCNGDLSVPRTLAETLGGIVAVSRPVADKGMAPKDIVVGSTGSSLHAKLALVLGVSGAAQFISGIRDVKTVIAINSDPEAQIFSQADYCVTGDLFKIVPELVSQLDSSSKTSSSVSSSSYSTPSSSASPSSVEPQRPSTSSPPPPSRAEAK